MRAPRHLAALQGEAHLSREPTHDAPHPRRSFAGTLLRAYRPRQWTKNLLVLAAPCAAGVIDRPLVTLRSAQRSSRYACCRARPTCSTTCATASTTGSTRASGCGRSPPARSFPDRRSRSRGITALTGLAIASAIDIKVGVIGLCYLALTASYSLWWRGVVVLDILTIAAGFVLRALAGGVATESTSRVGS